MKFTQLLLGMLALGCFTGNTYAQPAGYGYGKHLIVQSSEVAGSGTLTDYPMLVSITDPDLRSTGNGGRVENTSGYDIVFALDGACGTTLDQEIEYYDPTTGEYVAWVRIPSLSATTNTLMVMFYGNSAVATDPSVESTWNANFVGVYHLTNGSLLDSTDSNNDGTDGGTTGDNASSIIAGGRTFTPPNDYIEIGTTDWNNLQGTISMWGNSDTFTGNHHYFFGHTSTEAGFNDRIQLYTDDVNGNLDLGLGNSHVRELNIEDLNTAQWYYVTLTWDNGNYNVYVLSTAVATATAGTYDAIDPLQAYANIGNNGQRASRNESFDGTLDEVHISNTVRNSRWIQTSYNNQNDPSSFYTFSAEMSAALACSTLPISLRYFDATLTADNQIALEWQTELEIDNDFFTIERSVDGASWQILKEIKGAGNSNQLITYHSMDDDPYNGINYYRLKQTDFDGTYTYSNVVSVQVERNVAFDVYPNPAYDKLYVVIPQFTAYEVKIFDALGQEFSVNWTRQQNGATIDLSQLSNGVYLLVLNHGETTLKKKFIKK